MNASRRAFGVLLVACASQVARPALAQQGTQFADQGVQVTDLPRSPFSPPQDVVNTSTADPVEDSNFAYQDASTPESEEGVAADCALDEYCQPCNSACPRVYGMVEALFLWREPRLDNQPIVGDPNTGVTYLSTADLDYGMDPGIRGTIGARLCNGPALELTYFGLFEGDATALVTRPAPDSFLSFPNNLFGNVFVDMDRVQLNYSSWLNSAELNLPCCCGSCGQCCGDTDFRTARCRSQEWFGGFRYLDLGEEFDIYAERTVAGAVESGTYSIRTTNRLYGGQLGGRLRRTSGRFGWEATGKAGIFVNESSQEQLVTDFPDFALRPTVSRSSDRVAFVGDVNVSLLYRLTQVWNLRAGYNALLIEGLALAPDQLDFNFATAQSGEHLNNDGGLLLHGVNVGLEARW